ncbi:hypothetical protein [Flavobacterium sp.]|jgi:acyl carrier protein|uniref:hypothetical protein n=1 Tax=Flavobacterium sp. TaxID=239 RepID=UPI0037BF376F
MVALSQKIVEEEILKVINDTKKLLKIDGEIDGNSCPGNISGISSLILVDVISELSSKLKVEIPYDCYIFHDKKTKKQLSIIDAAKKLIKEGKDYGK